MIKLAMFTSLFFLIMSIVIGGNPGLCEEKCPLVVTDLSPKSEAHSTRPTITTTFRSTCGSDIDQSTIEIHLNGSSPLPHTVTGSGSEVTVSYTPEFPFEEDALHTVTVRAQDVNGVLVEKTWDFSLPFIY
ncbi:MAG: hypothetical protein JRJ02_01090 [Deltaproteobacteria bacterium]|nr:hypothetical protein [Deltaproteobacteria bacterium]